MAEFMQGFVKALTGAMEHHRGIQAQQSEREAEQQRETFRTLLQFSPDPEMKAAALTGLLNPPTQNYFGKLKTKPEYQHALTIISHMHGADQGGQTPDAGGPPPGGPPSPPPSTGGAPPAPPTPMAAAQPDAAPMTGGGGKTGPAPAPPGMPPMAAAGPPPEAAPPPPAPPLPAPPTGAGPAPVPPTPGGHPVDTQVQSGVFGNSYEEALSKSKAMDKGVLFQDPKITQRHEQYRSMLQELQAQGKPFEQAMRMVNDELFPQWARQEGMISGLYMRGVNQQILETQKQGGKEKIVEQKGQLAKDLASGKYENQARMEDVGYAHKFALKKLGLSATDQRVTWQEVRDPTDPNGIRTIKIPISQATAKSMAASGESLESKLPSSVVTRVTSAAAAKRRLERIQALMPELEEHIGPLAGQITSVEQLIGSQDPVVQRFGTDISQVAGFMTSVHASRGVAFLDRMQKSIGQLKTNPAALRAGIEESIGGMDDFLDVTGASRSKAPGRPGAPPAPPAFGGGKIKPPPTTPALGGGATPKRMDFDAQGNLIQ